MNLASNKLSSDSSKNILDQPIKVKKSAKAWENRNLFTLYPKPSQSYTSQISVQITFYNRGATAEKALSDGRIQSRASETWASFYRTK